MRRQIATLLLASALALAGCDNDNDDDGGGGGDGGDDGGMSEGPDTPMSEEPSGDVLAIAGRDANDEPARLDRTALDTQLGELLGDGSSAEPIAIEDDDDAEAALRRRQGN